MLFICSSSPLASPMVPAESLSGTLSLTIPFVIEGENTCSTSLTLTDSLNIYAVTSLTGGLLITAEFAEKSAGCRQILFSLSGMENESEPLLIYAVTGINRCLSLSSELYENALESLVILNTLGDYAYSGSNHIRPALDITGLSGSLKISLPQASAVLINDSFAMYADGTDLTKHLKYAEIDLYGDGELSAEFYGHIKVPSILQTDINSVQYIFETDSYTKSGETTFVKAKHAEGAVRKIKRNHILASEIAAAFGGELVFAGTDQMLKGIDISGGHFEAAKFIAETTNQRYRILSGKRSLVYGISADNPVFQPENIISWGITRNSRKNALTEIIYGSSGDDFITIETDRARACAGESVTLRIYSLADTDISSSAPITKTASKTFETVTETVLFEDGTGRISKPAYQVFTDGITAKGKTVFFSGSSMKQVSYSACYDTYELKSDTEGGFAVFASLKDRVFFVRGTGAEKKTIYAPHLCSRVSALQYAEAEYDKNRALLYAEIPHTGIINTTCGLNIKTPYGSGALIGAKIRVETKPLKITNRLEVSLWQK